MANISFESEKELEDFIFAKLQSGINPMTGYECEWAGRQVDISPYGVIDIMTVDHSPGVVHLTVVEVKKEFVTLKTYSQLARYIFGLEHYFREAFPEQDVSINGIVVAPETCLQDDTPYLASSMYGTAIETYRITFDAICGAIFVPVFASKKKEPNFSKFHFLYGISIIGDQKRLVADTLKFKDE